MSDLSGPWASEVPLHQEWDDSPARHDAEDRVIDDPEDPQGDY